MFVIPRLLIDGALAPAGRADSVRRVLTAGDSGIRTASVQLGLDPGALASGQSGRQPEAKGDQGGDRNRRPCPSWQPRHARKLAHASFSVFHRSRPPVISAMPIPIACATYWIVASGISLPSTAAITASTMISCSTTVSV